MYKQWQISGYNQFKCLTLGIFKVKVDMISIYLCSLGSSSAIDTSVLAALSERNIATTMLVHRLFQHAHISRYCTNTMYTHTPFTPCFLHCMQIIRLSMTAIAVRTTAIAMPTYNQISRGSESPPDTTSVGNGSVYTTVE